jgi:hypothetical protein
VAASCKERVRSLGERAVNPLMLATEAEFILRVCETTGVWAESDRSDGVIFSGEVVGAEILAAIAAAGLTERARIGGQARERYERRENVAAGPPIASRRQVAPGTVVAAERPLPSASEGLVREVVVMGKRWRAR